MAVMDTVYSFAAQFEWWNANVALFGYSWLVIF